LFTEFSADLLNRLLLVGLPVRGAWAYGDFYLDPQPGSICLAGRPIVEAYEWANCLELSGCVLAPSAESYLSDIKFLQASDEPSVDFVKCPVPLNRGRQKQDLFLLNQGAFFRYYHGKNQDGLEISRHLIMERFASHNKTIGVDQIVKLNNTLQYLEEFNPKS
jgi:hypothetical protein